MDIVLLLALAVVIALTIGFLKLYGKRKLSKTEVQGSTNEEVIQELNPRRRALAANRNVRNRQRIHSQENENDEEEADTPVLDLPGGKIGAKKLAKLQAKAEKKAQRENEEKLRQEKKKAQELAEEERKKIELKEKEEEQKREEQERKLREEKERQEYEEYLKLKETFSVQEEGWEDGGEGESQLQDFINHIKANKIVILEDLAAHFKLKTQDVISRINNLQADNQLTGVIDDRGKFIYISEEELEAVAKFVKQRGRVSIAELVENSNMLINLTPIVKVTD